MGARRSVGAWLTGSALLALSAHGAAQEVLRFPSGVDGVSFRPLGELLGAYASHVGGAVISGPSEVLDGDTEYANCLLQPVGVPEAEARAFLDVLCGQERLALREVTAASHRLLSVVPIRHRFANRLGLPGAARPIDVPVEELAAWRDRDGACVRTVFEVDAWRGLSIRDAFRDLLGPAPEGSMEARGRDGEHTVVEGPAPLVHELSLLLADVRRAPGDPPGDFPLDFFPPARRGIELPPDGSPLTLLQLLNRVTDASGQHFLCSRRERFLLERATVEGGGRPEVRREEVWAFLEAALRSENLSLAEIRRREPRLMSVGRLFGMVSDELHWARARHVPRERLEGLAAHPSLLSRTTVRVDREAVDDCAEKARMHPGYGDRVRVTTMRSLGAVILTGPVADVREAVRAVKEEEEVWKRSDSGD